MFSICNAYEELQKYYKEMMVRDQGTGMVDSWRHALEDSERLETSYMRLVEITAITPLLMNAYTPTTDSKGCTTSTKRSHVALRLQVGHQGITLS